MSVEITLSIPLSSFQDLQSGLAPENNPEILRALRKAIQMTTSSDLIRNPCAAPPLGRDVPAPSKKVTYTKVTRFRKPDDDPRVVGVLLRVEGSVDSKKYRLDCWTKMSSLRAALSRTNGVDVKDFSLWYQGVKVRDCDTAETLGMRAQDSIVMKKVTRPK